MDRTRGASTRAFGTDLGTDSRTSTCGTYDRSGDTRSCWRRSTTWNLGRGSLLVNDHDPKPLYHELRSTRGETFDWTYESREGDEWRVAIEKTDVSTAPDDDIITRYDVRQIPKQERHSTIHHRYGMIPDGETMEIVAPHEPRPLHQEFRERYGDDFSWNVLTDEPGECRVRITKTVHSDGDSVGTTGEGAARGDAIEVVTELDVRDRPPAQRHEAIFSKYDELSPGTGFVLVNDHDPKPLYHQFDAEVGDEFHWEYRQRDPGEFRVLIGKTAEASVGKPRNEDAEAPF